MLYIWFVGWNIGVQLFFVVIDKWIGIVVDLGGIFLFFV